MKGLIFDIKRFAVHDGPGIRTTVFFKGCPLKCAWCHNPESIGCKPLHINKEYKLNSRTYLKPEIIGREITEDELFAEIIKEQVFMDESGGGVTFSGGEPLLQHGFLLKMLEICKSNNIHTAVDTSLYSSWETIGKISESANLFLVDLKLIDESKHQQYTGVSNKLILENIKKLSASVADITIRIPVIPNVNTSITDIEQYILFLKQLPKPVQNIDLLPFHNTATEKYKRIEMENKFGNTPSMKKEDLTDIKNRFEEEEFTVKIGG